MVSHSQATKIKMRIAKIGKKFPNRKKITFTQEHKDNIRRAHLNKIKNGFVFGGHKQTLETRTKISQKLNGIERSIETRKKMSMSAKRGKDSFLWKGGVCNKNAQKRRQIEKSIEYRLWRFSVLNRDNKTCIWCGCKQNLHVDHIKPFYLYPELRFAIDNGRTLCIDCHKTTDTWGGYKRKRI